MSIIKPPTLNPGDLVGIVSPSWGGASLFPHRLEQGISTLEKLGLEVSLASNSLKCTSHTAGTPEERAADIHEMFSNSQIKAIIAAIGGNHSNQLLPHLDFNLISSNPKIFLGYSDITVLHLAFYVKAELVTFYGPSLLTGLAEYPEIFSYTRKHLVSLLFKDEALGQLQASKEWTDEFLDWNLKHDLKRPRKKQDSKGWYWLKNGKAKGSLIGGCINSLMHLRGTEYWPSFHKAVLFWEIPEGGVTPADVDAMLMNLELSNTFQTLEGMIVGRPYQYNKSDVEELNRVILTRTRKFSFPILCNFDVGHTDPVITVPIGVQISLNSEQNYVSIDESGCVL